MADAAFVAAAAARRYWRPFVGLLVAAGLLQLALFGYVTALGLAGTGDSRYYLHAAQTLRDTGHLLNPDGTPYRYWPPLYPVLLRAVGLPTGVRVLHGLCLLGSLLLWSWLGRQLLPARRALVVPVLLALSTPWLLVSKFVWAESVFLLLFAAYAVALWHWLGTGRWAWWAVATAVGVLLPLQRTLGLFLLAGVGVFLLVGARETPGAVRRWPLLLHLVVSVAGGMLWQWYALLVAGPSRYHPSRGWSQLLSSGADYGFVLSRWLLPLPSTGRTMLPHMLWAAVLVGLFVLLWPRRGAEQQVVAPAASETLVMLASRPEPASRLMLQALWSATLALVTVVAGLTVFAQSAAGTHDAERYASVLFGPVVLLVLAAWPARGAQWLGRVLLASWLLGAAVRVGHVALDLRRITPLNPPSVPGPGVHGKQVGTAGE
ncbi:hypothetical protein [Hymenobacter antarcticus]|uniref:Dolichyl-phosphate-mannose-protein mannosyltransferase n=1 Tax=Hymenobacter antarcticus TaxID=486270 RepID=A0ABP7PLE2_9BACT